MVHVGATAFATLQIEMDQAVDYRSKWSTNFHKDCMLENYFILLSRRNFQNSTRTPVGPISCATLQAGCTL